MDQSRQQLLCPQALAAQWQVLARMAVMLARAILRLETSAPRRALEQAEMLELWSHAALATLAGQMTDTQQNRANAPSIQRLKAIASALICLTLFLVKIKRRLIAQLTGDLSVLSATPLADTCCAPARRAGYLDSS